MPLRFLDGDPGGTVDGASLGGWGQLMLRQTEVKIRTPNGKIRTLDMLPYYLHDPRGWLAEESGVLVLVDNRAEDILVVDLAMDELMRSIHLDRQPNAGIRHSRLFPIRDDLLGLVYESGVVAILDDGCALWHTLHHNPGIFFRSVAEDVVWLEKEWPADEAGEPVGVRISDGALLP